MSKAILAALAILPGIVLMIYTYKKDKREKEPVSLLLLLFFLGVAAIIPVYFAEIFADDLLCKILRIYVLSDGSILTLHGSAAVKGIIYHIVSNLFGVGLIEEGAKFLILYFVTRNNKNFNCVFDGIVYSVFVSLGFATFENLMYVMEDGLIVALVRMVISVPGHFFFSVIMGIFYSWWKIYYTTRNMERKVKASNAVPHSNLEFSSKEYIVLALGLPVFFHGLFDYGCTIHSFLLSDSIILLGYIIIFRMLSKYSKHDGAITDRCTRLLKEKYPDYYASDSADSEVKKPSAVFSSPKIGTPVSDIPARVPEKEGTALDDILRTYESPNANRAPAAAPKDSEKDEIEQAIDEYIKSLKNQNNS